MKYEVVVRGGWDVIEVECPICGRVGHLQVKRRSVLHGNRYIVLHTRTPRKYCLLPTETSYHAEADRIYKEVRRGEEM